MKKNAKRNAGAKTSQKRAEATWGRAAAQQPCMLPLLVTGLCAVPVLRSAHAEDRLDFKAMYYAEDNGRMTVWEPGLLLEHDLSPTLSLRANAVYNLISGASPTGAPPAAPVTVKPVLNRPSAPSPSSGGGGNNNSGPGDDDDDDDDDDRNKRWIRSSLPMAKTKPYQFKAGATPPNPPVNPPVKPPSSGSSSGNYYVPPSTHSGAGTPAAPAQGAQSQQTKQRSGKVPKADVEDERTAFDVELIKSLENGHTPSLQLAYSSESDYTSMGVAVKDAISFNKKNTTLLLGIAYTDDRVKGYYLEGEEKKETVDLMVGVTQVLNPRTLFTANLTLGMIDGYLSDPYKTAEVGGQLLPDRRPDSKDRQVVYLSLTRFIESAEASVEFSYRFTNDSFGIQSHTVGVALYKKLSPTFTLRPALRYYIQNEADFYGVRFDGSPDYYSADYRVSAMNSVCIGLKGIYQPTERFAMDLAVDRYEQQGRDSVTSSDAYAGAWVVMFGVRVWL